VDRTNAERQRRHIGKLKAAAEDSVTAEGSLAQEPGLYRTGLRLEAGPIIGGVSSAMSVGRSGPLAALPSDRPWRFPAPRARWPRRREPVAATICRSA
jgi:hypothetical protein